MQILLHGGSAYPFHAHVKMGASSCSPGPSCLCRWRTNRGLLLQQQVCNISWLTPCPVPAQDVQPQLRSNEDDHGICLGLQAQLKAIKTRQANGQAVLCHLRAQLINVACDDPGAAVGTHLVLPLLREHLDRKALEHFSNRPCEKDLATQVGFWPLGLMLVHVLHLSYVLSVLYPI